MNNSDLVRFGLVMPVLLAILVVSVVAWFSVMSRFYRILRTRHSATYESLGRPTLFLNNSPQNGLATLRFLLGGKFRQLKDPELQRLGSFMQVFFYVYCAVFVSFAVLVVIAMPQQARGR